MANKPLLGYPTPVGGKYFELVDIQGPASYASPQTVRAADFGFGAIEMAVGGDSLSGTYEVHIALTTSSGQRGQPVTSYTQTWWVVATGLEVGAGVDLSGEWVRTFLIAV